MSYERRNRWLSKSEQLGIKEPRTCTMPQRNWFDNPSNPPVVPYVDYDSKNGNGLPCNSIVEELGTIRKDLSTRAVSPKGCLSQRAAGLCPRDFGLTPEEKAKLQILEKSNVAK